MLSRLSKKRGKALLSLTLLFLLITEQIAAQDLDWVRHYPLPEPLRGNFFDVYKTVDNGFAFAGSADSTNQINGQAAYWLVKTDREGEVEINRLYRDASWESAYGYSLIECENGGYVIGGYGCDTLNNEKRIKLIRTDADGEPIWSFIGPERSECYAVIEIKAGGYVACGRISNSEAYSFLIDDEAHLVWEQRYGQEIGARFNTLREVEGGFLFGGSGQGNNGVEAKLVRTDENGNVEWHRSYDFPEIFALISCRGGGFAVAGGYSHQGQMGGTARLLRVDQNGNPRWTRGFDAPSYALGLTQLTDGFALVGTYFNKFIIRTDSDGDSIWSRQFEPDDNVGSSFHSVISDPDGSVYVAGGGYLGNRRYGGTLIKLTPSRLAPLIMDKLPQSDRIYSLQSDSIYFIIRAIDPQDDSLSYRWSVNNREYFPDIPDSFSAFISFPNIGIDTVKCLVWADDGVDSATWHVTVTDLYVSAYSPDTLNLSLRRGDSVDFSLDTVRTVEGIGDVEYQWTKSFLDDPGQPPEIAGTESRATISFLQSGNYAVEGLAYRGEASDVVTWNVAVRGVVWSFAPEELALEVFPDSLIRFEVIPSNPEDSSLSTRWFVDEEFTAEDTTSLDWGFFYPVHSVHNIYCVLSDSIEADTISWTVTVRDLGIFGDEEAGRVRRPVLLSVSPNPFNSTLTIRYSSPINREATSISIHDISGREVSDLSGSTAVSGGLLGKPAAEGGATMSITAERAADHRGSAEEHVAIWDASNIPAGVYFVRLQTGAEISTKKVVLMR